MSELDVQICPETGICSIIKADGKKVDLMPDEVEAVRAAGGDREAIRKVLAEVDSTFADGLDLAEVKQVSERLK